MFDANMRHLPKGMKFFSKVHSCCEDTRLYDEGVRRNDIIICEMLSKQHENPLVRLYLKDKDIEVRSQEQYDRSWLVYEGQLDGTDFLSKDSKSLALKQLKGSPAITRMNNEDLGWME